MRTLKELAAEALSVQNACNLTGVVHAYSRAMTDLRSNLDNTSTDTINNHPIAILYASKLASLTSCENSLTFARAYEWASKESE